MTEKSEQLSDLELHTQQSLTGLATITNLPPSKHFQSRNMRYNLKKMRIEEMSEMNKAQIVAELEAMAWYRLFNSCQWLADRETIYAVNQKLIKMGLVERISSDTWRTTPSGKELDVNLFEVFMGLFDAWEVPSILEDHRLIDEWEIDSLYARMSRKANHESVLIGYVRRAYLDYRRAIKFLH
jgi:hypothetical protein